ncbi:MAG: glycosyl transferase [Clostridiales bacterium]|jgi:mannosyltransferase OCH1-like enzyme|nr:glycosyl transferase [Clostridiales bacterium]
MIPKIIHYAWFGDNSIPEKENAFIEKWKALMPDYEFCLWNEDNYEVTKIEYTKQAYEKKKYAFVTDYVRLDVPYTHGGIFLDTDVEVIKKYDDLLGDEAFAGFQLHTCRVNAGSAIGACAGNPVLKEMRDDYERRSFINPDGSLNLTTCTFYQTSVLKKHGLKDNDTKQELNGFCVYPSEYFCPMNIQTGEITITPNTYSIHHYSASWKSDFDVERIKLRRKLYKRFGLFGANIISVVIACAKHTVKNVKKWR